MRILAELLKHQKFYKKSLSRHHDFPEEVLLVSANELELDSSWLEKVREERMEQSEVNNWSDVPIDLNSAQHVLNENLGGACEAPEM